MVTDAEEVHVTSGAHQAISLTLVALAGRREPIAAETPGYPGFFDILEGTGHRLAPLRADRAGIVPESLEAALGPGGARVVYMQAGAQNPTGVVTSPGRLRALAAILDAHDAVVIEDATLAELVFTGRPPIDLARLCRRATVVSVGSFSKVLWGGLRVGWLRAPLSVVDRTLHRRLAQDLGPSTPSQLLTLALLPHLTDIVASRRAFLADNTARGAALLRAEIPEWSVPDPAGGSALWVDTGLHDTDALVQVAHRHGVHLAPGSIAVEGRRADPHLRICVDRPWPLVDAGLRRVGAAWRELGRRRRIAGWKVGRRAACPTRTCRHPSPSRFPTQVHRRRRSPARSSRPTPTSPSHRSPNRSRPSSAVPDRGQRWSGATSRTSCGRPGCRGGRGAGGRCAGWCPWPPPRAESRRPPSADGGDHGGRPGEGHLGARAGGPGHAVGDGHLALGHPPAERSRQAQQRIARDPVEVGVGERRRQHSSPSSSKTFDAPVSWTTPPGANSTWSAPLSALAAMIGASAIA